MGIFSSNITNFLFNYVYITMISMLLFVSFTQILFNIKHGLKAILLFISSTTLLMGTTITFSETIGIANYGILVKGFLSFFPPIIFSVLFLRINYVKAIISYALYNFILALGNLVLAAVLTYYHIDLVSAKTDLRISFLSYSGIYATVILLLFIMKSFKLFSKLPEEVRLKAYRTNIIYILLVFIIIVVNLYYFVNFSSFSSALPFVINIGVLIGYFIFSVLNTNTFFKLQTMSHELEYQVFYNKTLDTLMSDLRRFKHNYNNLLAALSGYVKVRDWGGLEKFLSEISEDGDKVSTINNISILNIKSAGILGIVTTKIEYAKERGIELLLVVADEVREVNMKISELCEIVGILLDNAIEAACDSKFKTVCLEISNTDGAVCFRIKNSSRDIIDTSKVFEEGYSTKGTGRGIGLAVVKKIVNRYGNVLLNTVSEGDSFKQELIIS